jgi:hypothetical protein
LEETERKITLLMQNGTGQAVEKPFPTEEGEKDAD